MRIVNVIEKTVPVHAPFRNSLVDLSAMTTTLVAVVTDRLRDGKPLIGYAFSSFGRYGCGGPLRERFIPRLLAAPPDTLLDAATGILSPEKTLACLMHNEKKGGHAERSMALGTLELALWDVVGKILDQPLYRVLADRYNDGRASEKVPCYVGGGFYAGPADSDAMLQDEVRRYLDAGYVRVKIKAAGLPLAHDLRRIEAVIALLKSGSHLALDLSCAFGSEQALAFAKEVAPYQLWWIEEPCDPLDFETYGLLARSYPGLLAGGENLFCAKEVDNFLRYGGFAGRIVVQPDPPLSYGVGEFARILEVTGNHGVPRSQVLPHGGNLMSLHVAAAFELGSAESYPDLFAEFGGFGSQVSVEDGMVNLPQAPGIGFETQPALFKLMSQLTRGWP